MAETTAQLIENGTSTQEVPEKRPSGRPRAERTAKADTGQGDVGETFFDQLKALTEQDWKDLYTVYLYRCEPYTDRKVTGNDNFIMKYTQPIDQQSVMEEYGSGKYLAVLNVFNPTTRHSKAAYSHYFRIMNMGYPPKLPLGEWINDGRNRDWAWAKPLLEQVEAKRLHEQQAAGTSAGMDQAAEMFKAAVAAVKTLRPDESPDKQNSLAHMIIQTLEKTLDKNSSSQAGMLDVVDKVIAAVSSKKGDDSPMLQLLMSQIQAAEKRADDERAFNRDLLAKLTESSKPKGLEEELSGLVRLKEIGASIFGRRAVESPSSGTDWGAVGLELGREVLKVGGGIAQALIMKNAPRPPASTVTLKPQLPASDATAQPHASPQANPEPQEEIMNQLQMINATYGPLFDMIAPHLVDYFHKSTGVEFREWFLEEHGGFAYREIRKFAPETILGVIELRKQPGQAPPHVQQLLGELQPPEKAAAFLQEFMSDLPTDEEEEGQGDPIEKVF